MDKRCVVICDSGIGGLRLLKSLQDRFPSENFVYFADYDNLPYGDKTTEQLFQIADDIYQRAKVFSPKLIVFACNTLSTTVLPYFAQKPISIIGVYPKAIDGNGVLLCTKRTASSKYVEDLKRKFKALEVVEMKDLASQIERVARFGGDIDLSELKNVRFEKYDYLSLGCTHYAFAKKRLEQIFKNIPIISGEDKTFEKIENFLTTNDAKGENGCVSFVGKQSEFIKNLYNKGIFEI